MRVRFKFIVFNHGKSHIVEEVLPAQQDSSSTRQESKSSGGPAPRSSLRRTVSSTITNAAEMYEVLGRGRPFNGSLKYSYPMNDALPTHHYYTVRLSVMVSYVWLYLSIPPHLTQFY